MARQAQAPLSDAMVEALKGQLRGMGVDEAIIKARFDPQPVEPEPVQGPRRGEPNYAPPVPESEPVPQFEPRAMPPAGMAALVGVPSPILAVRSTPFPPPTDQLLAALDPRRRIAPLALTEEPIGPDQFRKTYQGSV